jgi:CrcB protein
MERILFIGIAGLAGTLARYGLSEWVDSKLGFTFPYGTLLVNLAGCLAAGFLFQSLTERYLVDPVVRVAGLAGFLGGFTTFSAYALQTFVFLRNEQLWLAAIIMLASNLGGLVMVWIGYSVSKAM